MADLADHPVPDVLASSAGIWIGSPLRADLHDTVVAPRGVDHLPPFPNEPRRRLLRIDVLSRLARMDRHHSVPVVRCTDGDGIDVLSLKNAAVVVVEIGLLGDGAFTADQDGL